MKYQKNMLLLLLRFLATEVNTREMLFRAIEDALPDLNKERLLKINIDLCINVMISTYACDPPGIYRRELVDNYLRFSKNYLKMEGHNSYKDDTTFLEYYRDRRSKTWRDRESTRKELSVCHDPERIKSAGRAIDIIMLPYVEEDINFFEKKKTEPDPSDRRNPETYWVASDKLVEALITMMEKHSEPNNVK